MEKLLLGALLACHELYVVYKEHIQVPVFFTELGTSFVLDGLYIVIHEGLTGIVEDLGVRVVFEYVVGHRMHEVGLAETNASVQIKYLVYVSGALSHSYRGCMGHLVAVSDYKGGKCIFGVEVGLLYD